MRNIFSIPGGSPAGKISRLARRLRLDRFRGERGSSLVEFAFVLPLFLMLITGMAAFGIALNQYLELTNAVGIGAQYLANLRADTTDPCKATSQVIYNSAPFLNSSDITLTYVLNGTTFGPYTGASNNTCSSSSTTTGAAGDLVEAYPAEVIATYPCTLAVFGVNFVPGCKLYAQVTEIVQ